MVALFALFLSCGPKATPPEAAAATPIPVDPLLRTGKLDNGLTYYIFQNDEPADRAVLRLVVRTGSILEDDDQLGLAHFVEHMAFNGTEHFPHNQLIDTMGAFGVEFGPHVNAHTAYDETVYKLQIPTADPVVVRTAFQVLGDWAGAITFDPEEIEKERGVVLEEWRSRQGAGMRAYEKFSPARLYGSLYPDRLPIGNDQSLQAFAPEALVRFYEDWYRPDLMAVIAVGAFDPATIETLVREEMSDLTAPAKPRPREIAAIPPHPETLVTVVADPEATEASVALLAKRDWVEQASEEQYRETLVFNLLSFVMNERLADIAKSSDAPFLGAGIGRDRLTPTEGMFVAGAGVRPDAITGGLEAVLTEVHRMRLHGVTEPELARARSQLLQAYERMWSERDNTHSVAKAEELVRVFTTGESIPGIDWEYRYATRVVPTITPDEIRSFASGWMGSDSRVLEVGLPDKAGVVPPTNEALLAVVRDVEARDPGPPLSDVQEGPLMDPLPTPGSIVAREGIPELGVTTWKLSNGATILVKQTDFKADEIKLVASSPGGLSTVPDADYVRAAYTDDLTEVSGLGKWDDRALAKRLSGQTVQLNVGLGQQFENLNGHANGEALETLLQMVHLAFTAPRFDEAAMANFQATRRTALENRLLSPDARFEDAWDRILYGDNVRKRAFTVEDVAKMDLAYARTLWSARFANAGDFTFLFVGSVDPAVLEPLVTRYLGSLPSGGTRDAHTATSDLKVPGVHVETIHGGSDPKARVRIQFHGPFEGSWLERSRLESMTSILKERLREELREGKSGVYGVAVGSGTDQWPVHRYGVTVSFGCDPARVDELTQAVFAVIEELKKGPVDVAYVQAEIAKNRVAFEQDLRENGFWTNILDAIEREEDPRELLHRPDRFQSLTAAAVQTAAKKYLHLQQYAQLTMLPEATIAKP
jgi:zinc protease